MKISGIIWLREIVEKISRKHRVDQEEVRGILSGSVGDSGDIKLIFP